MAQLAMEPLGAPQELIGALAGSIAARSESEPTPVEYLPKHGRGCAGVGGVLAICGIQTVHVSLPRGATATLLRFLSATLVIAWMPESEAEG